MNRLNRRGAAAMEPMPHRLDTDALLRVSDQCGRVVRSETLQAGSDLRERLHIARENYQRQGWAVGELRPGQWTFVAGKGGRRLLVAIRPGMLATAASGSRVVTAP